VYYEMKLGSMILQAKSYIDAKHLCPDDAHVSDAIVAYYHELRYSDFAHAYTVAMQPLVSLALDVSCIHLKLIHSHHYP
jgi:hypothetical protein